MTLRSKYPQLNLAFRAMELMGEDKDIVAGNLEAFDAWVHANPTVLMNMGSSREFLKALCPLRYNHNKKSRNYENLVALFGDVVAADRKRDKRKVNIDKDYGSLRSLRTTKASEELACRIVDTFASQLSEDDEICIGEGDITVGIHVTFGPATMVAIDCVDTEWSKDLGRRIASIVSDDESISINHDEEGNSTHLVDLPLKDLVGIRLLVKADKAEKENAIHCISSAIHQALLG